MENDRLLAACCCLGFAGAATAAAEQPCGGPDRACVVEDGDYHAALPDDPQGAPVVLWLHGYASSGASAVRNEAFAARFTDRGFALISPNGQPSWGDDP